MYNILFDSKVVLQKLLIHARVHFYGFPKVYEKDATYFQDYDGLVQQY